MEQAFIGADFTQVGAITRKVDEISGSHGGEYEDDRLLGYCAV
jgi:hypothetical protein